VLPSRWIGTTHRIRNWGRSRNHQVIDLAQDDLTASLSQARDWLAGFPGGTLNVAGPRESKHPGIAERARAFLQKALQEPGV
jgi:hypothetical protein